MRESRESRYNKEHKYRVNITNQHGRKIILRFKNKNDATRYIKNPRISHQITKVKYLGMVKTRRKTQTSNFRGPAFGFSRGLRFQV